ISVETERGQGGERGVLPYAAAEPTPASRRYRPKDAALLLLLGLGRGGAGIELAPQRVARLEGPIVEDQHTFQLRLVHQAPCRIRGLHLLEELDPVLG